MVNDMKNTRPKYQQIYVEITNSCNLSCPFCLPTTRKTRQMSLSEIEEIAKKLESYTHSVYLHVKGEPLLHDNLKEIIRCFTDHKINVKITTNGIGIIDHYEYLLDGSVKKINISLQSVHNMSAEYQLNYYENIGKFIEKNQSTHIYLRNWALDNDSRKDIEQHLSKLFPQAVFKDGELLSNYVHYSIAEKFEWPSLEGKEQINSPCLGGKNQLGILADGTVVLCCLDTNGDTAIGNIFVNDLDEIIHSDKYQKAVTQMPYFDLCKKCSYRLKFKK